MEWATATQRRTGPSSSPVSAGETMYKHKQRRKSTGTLEQTRHVLNHENQSSLPNVRASKVASTSTTPTSFAISLEQEPKCANGVPIIVESCLHYFTKIATDYVGLFRIPGSERRVQQMWRYMQDNPRARLSTSCVGRFMHKNPDFAAYDVADFLKQFIKSILGKEPMITHNCYAPLVSLVDAPCPAHLTAEKARRIIHQLLVPARRALLGRLCKFLKDFSQHEGETTMDCESLSVCFGYFMQVPPESLQRLCAEKQSKQSSLKRSQVYIADDIIAEQIRTSVFTKREKTELCISVIGILIQYAHHIFISCLSPPLKPPRSSSKTRPRCSDSKTRRRCSSSKTRRRSDSKTKRRSDSKTRRRHRKHRTRKTRSAKEQRAPYQLKCEKQMTPAQLLHMMSIQLSVASIDDYEPSVSRGSLIKI